MRALDTNVLVRFLVRDDRKQASAVYRAFKHAEETKEVFFIPVLVVLETIWVLETVYQISRNDILNSFEELLLMPILEFEAQFMVRKFLSSARETGIELSDLLIANSAGYSGCDCVLTFDRRALKYEFFKLMGK